MKPIGGEIEIAPGNEYLYLTDSGRSSLRLILISGLRDKYFLVPDFICPTVIDILKEFGVHYDYYHINPDLTLDTATIAGKPFDVFYSINYFGQRPVDLPSLLPPNCTLLEDGVFYPLVENTVQWPSWIGFNSFRKITPLADGSIIRSTVKLYDTLIMKQDAQFSQIKYEAKQTKHMHLHQDYFQEEDYLALFQRGEQKLNEQKVIHSISGRSLFLLFDYFRQFEVELMTRRNNYQTLTRQLKEYPILQLRSGLDRKSVV
jgi:hypothetical protein